MSPGGPGRQMQFGLLKRRDFTTLRGGSETEDSVRSALLLAHSLFSNLSHRAMWHTMFDEVNDGSILKTGRFARYQRSLPWGQRSGQPPAATISKRFSALNRTGLRRLCSMGWRYIFRRVLGKDGLVSEAQEVGGNCVGRLSGPIGMFGNLGATPKQDGTMKIVACFLFTSPEPFRNRHRSIVCRRTACAVPAACAGRPSPSWILRCARRAKAK